MNRIQPSAKQEYPKVTKKPNISEDIDNLKRRREERIKKTDDEKKVKIENSEQVYGVRSVDKDFEGMVRKRKASIIDTSENV